MDLGNIRVGGSFGTQALTIQNTAANDTFSERLNASIGGETGDASASGSFSLLGAQQTNSADLVVGLGNADTSTAGAKSGTATISLESDGTGTSNIVGNVDLGTQTVNVSGNVYRLAEGLAQEAGDNVIDFGNFLVGNTVTRNLTITNTALNDTFSEELNALFGTLTNGTPSFGTLSTNGGSVDLLGAGQSNSVNMTVSYMAAAAGSIGGSVEILFESDGTNTSGFSAISIDPDVLSIFGIIGQAGTLAIAGPATPNPVTGSIRVGDTLVEGLSISNLATAPAEGLNAYFSGTSDAAITANGTVGTPGSAPGLAPGAVSTGDLSVQVAGNAAGNISGTATLKLESDGTFNSGTITNLADQTINVDVDVFRLAEAGAHSPEPVVINARVGELAAQALSMTNTAANDGFSEGLNASIGGATGDATAVGSFNLLGAGDTDSSSLVVGIDTTTAGAKSGTATITAQSDGAGTSNIAGNVDLADQTVNVSGNVYQTAQASVSIAPIDFGIVHVGDLAERTLAVSNTAPVAALNDTLTGGIDNFTNSRFSAPANLGTGVMAGGTDNTSLLVSMDTGSAGVLNGAMDLELFSHNQDLADLLLVDETIGLSGQVNEYANPAFDKSAGNGALTGSGVLFTLNFGDILLGSGATLEATAAFGNNVLGTFVDLMDGDFVSTAGDFVVTNLLTGFDNAGAGIFFDVATIAFDSTGLSQGLYSGALVWQARGHNASGYEDFRNVTLAVRANIVDAASVPEPAVLLLLIPGLLIMLRFTESRRRTAA